MEQIEIHKDIKEKLEFFISNKKIPNIIFHGPSGSGKRTIVHEFINTIYDNKKDKMKSYVLIVNCAHGKGIKFIREEVKFFAKTHINYHGGNNFKSIILLNADKLTIDAQSALRRCIEQCSHNTRFFIIVEDKYKLLKPIISRFCEIYIGEPIIDNKIFNLHQHNLAETYNFQAEKRKKNLSLQKLLSNKNDITYNKIEELSIKLYEKGYSGIDLMNYIEKSKMNEEKKYQLLICFNRIRKEFRNEKMLILFILNFYFLRSDYNLENISFM